MCCDLYRVDWLLVATYMYKPKSGLSSGTMPLCQQIWSKNITNFILESAKHKSKEKMQGDAGVR